MKKMDPVKKVILSWNTPTLLIYNGKDPNAKNVAPIANNTP